MLKMKLAVCALAATATAAAATAVVAQEPEGTVRSSLAPATYVYIYEQHGLNGHRFWVAEADRLPPMRRFESLRTVGGAFEVCDRPNFEGECRVIEGRYDSVSRTGLRRIASLRPVASPGS
ncbi:beta/gamma crystallin-related protein [Brevundimonas sp. FT23028]|uniref:beta/gamma crystallin-related protein n=1 Tax=Brevundimonas sp. FT23028 TaxID=3393748 RepID=UPI003B589752